jgi:hypothetical protein
VKVIRSQPESNFTIIPNEALRDDRLSYTARGVLCELLSHRSGWETNADIMSARARQKRGAGVGEGRRAMRAAFAELEAAGYMVRVRERIPAGQPGAGRVVTTLCVYDTPQSHRGTAGGMSADGTSVSGTPVTGTSVSGTSSRSTVVEDVEKTMREGAGEEHSSALAAARAGQHARKRDDAHLTRLYAAADGLDDVSLRRLLLQFEKKRPQVHRECRQAALGQLDRQAPWETKGVHGARTVDLLSYKYALQHYADSPQLPTWLTTLPRQRNAG